MGMISLEFLLKKKIGPDWRLGALGVLS